MAIELSLAHILVGGTFAAMGLEGYHILRRIYDPQYLKAVKALKKQQVADLQAYSKNLTGMNADYNELHRKYLQHGKEYAALLAKSNDTAADNVKLQKKMAQIEPVARRMQGEATSLSSELARAKADLARAQAQAAKPVKLVESGRKVVEVVDDDEPVLPVPTPKEAYENPKPHPFNFTVGTDSIGRTIVASNSPRGNQLIAGVTGAGKSNAMRLMIGEAIQQPPTMLKFIMIDMKRADLRMFEDIPHLAAPVAVTLEDAVHVLLFVRAEIARRMDRIVADKLTSMDEYAQAGKPLPFPYLHVVVDEVAELTLPPEDNDKLAKRAEGLLRSIASLCRASGILLTVATQLPIAKLLPTQFRGNLGCTIAYRVNRLNESMAVLGEPGAEKISGVGKCIFRHNGYTTSVATPFMPVDKTIALAESAVKRYGKPNFSAYDQFVAEMAAAEDGADDVPLFDKGAVMAAA